MARTFTEAEVTQIIDAFVRQNKVLRAEIDEADARAGHEWRLLRRYKHKVRELNAKIEAIIKERE